MRARWGLFLWIPFLVSFTLLTAPLAVFLRGSLFQDLGLGRFGTQLTLANYARVVRDSLYLESLWLTAYISAITVGVTLVVGFPLAYSIARLRSRWTAVLLAGLVISSFVSIVIKALGLTVIFSGRGPVNRALLALGLTVEPVTILGSVAGVVVGLLHYTLGFGVLLLFGVIQTIPRSLEEAAQVHGASRLRVFQRVVIPLALPGVVVVGLTVFNLCMGAFTSAAILGKGNVLTLPVLIWRTILLEVKYGMGGTLAAVLLGAVLLVNLVSVLVITRFRGARLVAI
ncbi:MAG TPA: ABC transporter permease [Methylomirabilota bacterium]|jgi:putative spermidine/putrescine transport system permease protein